MTVLLVDVANVVGSRPDGWWRDRAGAAGRLLAGLAALPGRLPGPGGADVGLDGTVAVVEGAARDVPAPGGIRLVRAAGPGDDALVAVAGELAAAGEDLLVVTADRGLRARLPAGAVCAGPGWLWARIDGNGMTSGGTG
ncbi:hypothetical protein [Blastococcus saxobsidens]|uniref:NTP pyrophosphohydrolase n=2 Tax=Blastococcus saxobsidens TaxID=138336 RepID=A0A4Q7Y6V1_9ACTN|nr:hypothetical protein [Blastococcus saxobsidens]RZU32408.1 hypothetical protein BKA19_2103 [Blastococcus saxobsidens]